MPRLGIASGALCLALLAVSTAGAVAAVGGNRGKAIESFFARWSGTPYRWGGTSRSGIDCSAYLRQMYRDLFGVELPRTTRQQIRLGVDLPIDGRRLETGLEPGDLVFFVDRTGTPNHVVVYAGEARITHSVSGRGVVYESIDRLYGRRVVGRRLLLPAKNGQGGRFAALPAAPPIVATEIPCPDRFAPSHRVLRRWSRDSLSSLEALGKPELCTVRLLAEALEKRSGPTAGANAKRLFAYADWLERLDATAERLFGEP